MTFKDFFISEAVEPKDGFCGSPQMPDHLARKLIAAMIETHYYAAMSEGASYADIVGFAFAPKVLLDALNGMFCDALPKTIGVLVKDEINKHPLTDNKIRLSAEKAQQKWNEANERFSAIEAQIEEFCRRGGQLEESLSPEKQMFDNPQDEFELEIDGDDDNNGTIHYMGYDFPISKRNQGGHIEYIVGSVDKSVVITGNTPQAFAKVVAALDSGKVPARTQSKSSMFSKVQRDIPQTVDIEFTGGKVKTYKYVEPGKVDALVTKLYDEYGPHNYQDAMKEYATDRPSGDIHNPYIQLTMIARQNVYRHKLGTKDGSINYKSQ